MTDPNLLANYNLTYASATFTITRKTASVTPIAARKIYGANDPTLIGTLSDFLASDNIGASYSRTAGESVLGGPYTISATLTGVLSNYEITYHTATFTITRTTALGHSDNG